MAIPPDAKQIAEQIFERAKQLTAELDTFGLGDELLCSMLGSAYLLALSGLPCDSRAEELGDQLRTLVGVWLEASLWTVLPTGPAH